MNSRMRKLAVALALLCAAAAGRASAAVATEAQWIAAATQAVAFGQQQGLPIMLRVERGDGLPGHTPIGIQSEEGVCTLVVSARDNPAADRLSALVDPTVLDLFLQAAAIHEVGHCHRRLAGFPHNERLVAPATWFAFARNWFVRRIRTEEAYADLTAVAWLARYHPADYAQVVGELARIRARYRDPKHDTLPWLAAALRDGPRDPGGDLFVLAGKALSRGGPWRP